VNFFDFTVSRHRDVPDLLLIEAKYQGTLLGSCYGVNTGIALRSADAIKHAACVSHARRHVRAALDNHKVHGQALMHFFGKLYDMEDRGRVTSPSARLELRLGESRSIWNSIREYIDNHTGDLLPKDAMSKAINYLRNQWTALIRYVDDPLIPIDNNETE
jgi:transposase